MSIPDRTESTSDAQTLVDQAEIGSRHPGGLAGKVLFGTALAWALFQLWYASPLPFLVNFGIFNAFEARSIHLAFALFLAYAAFPAVRGSQSARIPIADWLLGLAAAFCAAYLFLNYQELSQRAGVPAEFTQDIWIALVGLLLLLEATRRALGWPLTLIATGMLIYTFAGPYMPDLIAHDGKSLLKIATHQWLTQEGVFGVPLGVSTDFVFLFVLFGAMLSQAGAGNWFIQTAFALVGHLRGGPAKAAVVASAVTGIVSGSSIANVATTGTYTIPLMKRLGFPASKAGAIEVAASTNGQLTPPVMGAAAFVMIEYVGISYVDVIRHAILPALISYIALIYIVHLEATKAGMRGLPKTFSNSFAQRLLMAAGIVLSVCLVGLGVYFGIGWLKPVAGAWALPILGLLLLLIYVGLVRHACQVSEIHLQDDRIDHGLPRLVPTFRVGIYFLLPLILLMWCLMVERLSAGLAAFWASVLMIFIVLTQRPLIACFCSRAVQGTWRQGFDELITSLVSGARGMVPIGIATATAGIVVGTVTLTGIGNVMVELVEALSGGSFLLALVFTALICVILGMGLPTTANYIVVSSLMAPVVIELGAANGIVLPLIAVHLFVFYFGILADDTPPVGLAAYVAAAIAKTDPIKTGIQGFAYDIRTAVLPFMFIFNTQLLLIGIDGWLDLVFVILSAVAAILLFTAAVQGYWFTRNRRWETIALLLVAFVLFRPDFIWDRLYPPLEQIAADQLESVVSDTPANGTLRLLVSGEDLDGNWVDKTVGLSLPTGPNSDARLLATGLSTRIDADGAFVDFVTFDSPAQNQGIESGWEITGLLREADRPPEQLAYLPALALLAWVFGLQTRRRRTGQ